MMVPPSTCSALVQKDGKPVKGTISVPTPQDRQVLVKVAYVAQNPTDVQASDRNVFGDNAVLGCDFVGTVEKLGPGVSRLKEGDVIAGLIWGGEIKELGAYAGYTLADERICFVVPGGGILEEEAATIPLAACTAQLALFSRECLGIDRKSAKGQSVLVWGGSSSVGQYAIQIGALHGLNVIATCSPRHHAQARELGAKHVFDYRDGDAVKQIVGAAPDLKYVFDTIGNDTSSVTASRAIANTGGRLCTVRPGKAFTGNVSEQTTVTDVLVWTAFLKEHRYGDLVWPPNEGDHELAVEFFEKLPGLISDKTIRPNNVKVNSSGLDGVAEGFQEYRDGKISNYKIVYKL